jgi:hypothetical protein
MPKPTQPAGEAPEVAVYLKRLENARTSIDRVFLGFLALLAFWLAIEIGYAKYQSALSDNDRLNKQTQTINGHLSANAKQRNSVWQNIIGGEPIADPAPEPESKSPSSSEASASGDVPPLHNPLAGFNDQREGYQKALADQDAKRRQLRTETLDLSILGTKLPSTITTAAQLWLAALVLIALFLLNYRQTVFRNLTLLHGALPPHVDRFGQAGDGTPLLAPLPPRFAIPGEGEVGRKRIVATRRDFHRLLGWGDRTTRYSRYLSFAFIGFVSWLAFRVTWIAFRTSGDRAFEAKFVDMIWYLLGFPIAVALLAVTLIIFGIILFPRAYKGAQIRGERRLLIGWGAAAVLTVVLDTAPKLTRSAKRLLDRPAAASRRRRDRMRLFFAVSDLTGGGIAITSRKDAKTAYWVERGGMIRLWSRPRGKAVFERLELVRPVPALDPPYSFSGLEVRKLGEDAHKFGARVDVAGRMDAFERMAMAMLDRDEIIDAIDCLLFACQINLRDFSSGLNLRLFDLLRGLMIRYEHRTGVADRVTILRTQLRAILDRTAFLTPAAPAGRKLGSTDRRILRHRQRLAQIHADLDPAVEKNLNKPRFKKWLAPGGRQWSLRVARAPHSNIIAGKIANSETIVARFT